MKLKIATLAICAISPALFLSSCVLALGNKGEEVSKGTVGQQLVDLQKAKNSGLLTPEEYKAQRAKILDQDKTN